MSQSPAWLWQLETNLAPLRLDSTWSGRHRKWSLDYQQIPEISNIKLLKNWNNHPPLFQPLGACLSKSLGREEPGHHWLWQKPGSRWVEEILLHLDWLKPYKSWGCFAPISWPLAASLAITHVQLVRLVWREIAGMPPSAISTTEQSAMAFREKNPRWWCHPVRNTQNMVGGWCHQWSKHANPFMICQFNHARS